MPTKRKNKNNFQKQKSNFTLIETLVALIVLAVGVLSVIALSTKSYTSISLQRNKLIANNLAREGVELVRNVRDENWMSAPAVGDVYTSNCNNTDPPTKCDGTNYCGDNFTRNIGQVCEDGLTNVSQDCDWRCGNEEEDPLNNGSYKPSFKLDSTLRDISPRTDPNTGLINGIEAATGPATLVNTCTDTNGNPNGILLKKDNNKSFYNHTNGQQTPFYRLITIKQNEDTNKDGNLSNDLWIQVRVCWRERGGDWQEILAEEHLYNWKRVITE